MISALLYLQYHSTRNRLVSRIKRLKQPKYLAGAIVGGLYFYFYFLRHLSGGARIIPMVFSPERRALAESLGALALFVAVLLGGWLIPRERTALTFTEAELAFLLPAPITRRGLVHYKLLRSQMRILFGVLFLALVSRRLGGGALVHALGFWLILSVLNLHFLGASFARTMLLDRGISNWVRRLLVFCFVLAGLAAVMIWAKHTMPGMSASDIKGLGAVMDYAQRVLSSGPALYLLYPFRLIVRPFLAPDALSFLYALGPAVLLLLAHYAWVHHSDVAFEEASAEASQRLADRITAARTGNLHGAKKTQKSKRPLFKLAPTGPLATALLWKNLIAAGQTFTSWIWISILILAVCLSLAIDRGDHSAGLFMGATVLIGALLAWSLLLGPQVLRKDLRQDMPFADVLKAYPMRGWQIVLGELLAPAAILACVQWLLLAVGARFLLHARGMQNGVLPFGVAFGAAFVLPMLDLIQLLIPNAAVLLFPSWIQTGKDAPRGIEATGQRVIFMLGQLVVFTISLIPAALFFLATYFLANMVLGSSAAVVIASISAALMLAVEVGLGVMLLGRLFERFDVTAETMN